MKKLAAVLLVFGLTGCAKVASAPAEPARATVLVTVDTTPQQSLAGYAFDGKTYVDTADLARVFQRQAEWNQTTNELRVYRRPATPTAPAVVPYPETFNAKVNAALQLLKDKAPQYYALVTENVELIAPGQYNLAFQENNTITIAEDQSPTWLASALAHEAEHLKTSRTNRILLPNRIEDERDAYTVSLEALKLIGAPQREVDLAQAEIKNPATNIEPSH